MKRFLLFLLGFAYCQIMLAQETTLSDSIAGTVLPEIVTRLNVERDPRLDKLLSWHIEKNTKINGIAGYRIEIFFSPENDAFEKAKQKKIEFLSLYPNITVHIKYDAPYFRVRVGDFRTKNEALKLYTKIKRNYPVAFIVADNIDFPLLKQEKNERSY